MNSVYSIDKFSVCVNASDFLYNQLREIVSSFCLSVDSPVYNLHVKSVSEIKIPSDSLSRGDCFYTQSDDLSFCLISELIRFEICLQEKEAVLEVCDLSGQDSLSFILYALKWYISFITIHEGGIPLHSSSVFACDRAFLFAGESGAGKSTICSILSSHPGGFRRGSDEFNLLFITDEGVKVFPTPYTSSAGDCQFFGGMDLKKLYIIKKASYNCTHPLAFRNKYYNCLKNIYTKPASSYLAEKMFENVEIAACAVDCNELYFANNNSLRKFLLSENGLNYELQN
ncbi:hypothetical protein CHISP_2754 [Chitinispirillum alkaliphilum]|nr:hypothetical protein CHISP_2754 [Chitinispirillum alkaliphilum]